MLPPTSSCYSANETGHISNHTIQERIHPDASTRLMLMRHVSRSSVHVSVPSTARHCPPPPHPPRSSRCTGRRRTVPQCYTADEPVRRLGGGHAHNGSGVRSSRVSGRYSIACRR